MPPSPGSPAPAAGTAPIPRTNRGVSPTDPAAPASYRRDMDAPDTELKKELDATLQARSELGAEYESALVESFLEKVEQRLDSTLDRRVRRHLAEQQIVVARGASSPEPPRGTSVSSTDSRSSRWSWPSRCRPSVSPTRASRGWSWPGSGSSVSTPSRSPAAGGSSGAGTSRGRSPTGRTERRREPDGLGPESGTARRSPCTDVSRRPPHPRFPRGRDDGGPREGRGPGQGRSRIRATVEVREPLRSPCRRTGAGGFPCRHPPICPSRVKPVLRVRVALVPFSRSPRAGSSRGPGLRLLPRARSTAW